MDVQLVLKNWEIVRDEKLKKPRVTGKYAVMMGDKEIATQEFNGPYGSKDIPFSEATVEAIAGLEVAIKAELEKFLT